MTHWFVGALVVVASVGRADDCVHYEPVVVELTGKIVRRTFFGPPNFGEHPESDRRVTQTLLELDRAICVVATPGDDTTENEADQRIVTLGASGGLDLRRYAGERVAVRGTLFHAQTAWHNTPVLLTVSHITRIGPHAAEPKKP
jgi:hypothetical protein